MSDPTDALAVPAGGDELQLTSVASVALVAPDRHPVAVYLGRLSPGSRRTMREALETIARILTEGALAARELPWHQLRYQHTSAVRARLAELYAPATTNKMLSALRGVLKECWRLGSVDAETYHRAVDLERVKGSTLPRGRALGVGELRALVEACTTDRNRPLGARDAALFAVLFAGGLRRAEAVGLDLADFDPESGGIQVRRGKGRKARTVYLKRGARDVLDAWLLVRGQEGGPLFVPVDKAAQLGTRRLTAQAVLDRCRYRAREAGLARFSPHDFRRTFISELLDAGADIATVQRMAGHANPQTTSRYDRRGERVKEKTSELLHFPYVAPS